MTVTTTLRPAATIHNGSNVVGGGGSLYTVLADNSDSTLATTILNDYNKIRFATSSLTAGAIVDHVVLRLRTSRFAGQFPVAVCGLNDRATIQIKPTTNNPTYATQSSAPQGGFTAADVAAGVVLEWGSDPEFVLSEAYLDVTYVAVPTVNVTAPTGTIGVTQPEITWVTTSDNPQSNYQTRIFTQPQYSAAGFNPSTSVAFYDSGIQTGNADSIVPFSINLTNGGTYRFYVRAAQRVGSATQWSAWNYEEATVTVTPPNIPTIAAVPDDLLARIQLTIDDVTGALPWEFVTVERTTDTMNWTPVRSATRAPVFGTTFTVYDYESSNGQDVQYRARAIASSGSGDIASDWSALSTPAHWTSTGIWLKSLTLPSVNAQVVVNDIPTLTRRLPQDAFDVAGRRDPVVVSDTRHLAEGTATFVALDNLALDQLLILFDRSEVLLLQTPVISGWGSRYIAIGDVNENRVSGDSTEQTRLVDCPFIEVLAPAGDIVGGFGVSWDDVITLYPTWADITAVSWSQLLQS